MSDAEPRPEPYGLMFAGKAEARAKADGDPSVQIVPALDKSIRFDAAADVLIEGDNLEVLKALLPAYFGRVQMIYIDPPYNTGNDFVYVDDFRLGVQEYLEQTRQVDGMGNVLVANPETSGRHHSRWLAMMYPRLAVAQRLLRQDGLLFVSIDDNEVHNLRLILDEIFGAENFLAQVSVISNRGGRDYLPIALTHEYVLIYGRSPEVRIRELQNEQWRSDGSDARGAFVLRELRNRNPRFHPGNRPNLDYPIYVAPECRDDQGRCAVWPEATGPYRVKVVPRNRTGGGSVWRWGRDRLKDHLAWEDAGSSEVVARRRRDGNFNIYEKHRKQTVKPRSVWDDKQFRSEQGTRELTDLLGSAQFDHPKPVTLVRRCVELATDPDGIVLDFFAGSGTTAQAVMEQNRLDGGRRRYLLVQLPERLSEDKPAKLAGHDTICDIARARIERFLQRSEADGEGLRVFRARDGIDPDQLDPFERMWPVVLEQGLGLDASLQPCLGLHETWRVGDRTQSRELVVCFEPRVDHDLVRHLDLSSESRLVCLDGAVDAETAFNLGRRGMLRLL